MTDGSAVELVEVLTRAAVTDDEAPIDLELAELVESLDLCEVSSVIEEEKGQSKSWHSDMRQ